MNKYFINAAGNYYVSDTMQETPAGHTSVTERPRSDATWDGSAWSSPTLEVLRTEKLEALRIRRNVSRDGGIIVSGTPIPTDEETRSVLTGTRLKTVTDDPFSVSDWKVTNGVFATLSQAQIIDISNAVVAHVQACFTQERVLTDLINAATTEIELNAVDIDTGWP